MNLVVLDKTIEVTPTSKIDKVNMVTIVVYYFSGFLCSREVTFKDKDYSNQCNQEDIGLLCSDVIFSNIDKHIILALKCNKTNYNYNSMKIIMSATGNSICPIKVLRQLFREDLYPINTLLFRFVDRMFSYANFITILYNRLSRIGIPNYNLFTSYSFRRGTITTTKLERVLDSDIQRLRRQSSKVF